MNTVVVGSIGGYEGSTYPHPQRQLDAPLPLQGHVNEAEVSGDLPDVRTWIYASQPPDIIRRLPWHTI